MGEKEKKFRSTHRGSRKYAKHLEEYIVGLLGRGRFIEASHFFNELFSIKPDRIRVVELGYDLAIKTLRIEDALFYDRELFDKLGKNKKRLIFLRLKLYHALHKEKEVAGCLKALFDEKWVVQDNRDDVLDIALSYGNHHFSKMICVYLKGQGLSLNTAAEKRLKKDVVQSLVNGLVEVGSAKFFSR